MIHIHTVMINTMMEYCIRITHHVPLSEQTVFFSDFVSANFHQTYQLCKVRT